MTILLFGASGSAGGAVLGACLDAADVAEVRVVGRRPLEMTHAKLVQVVHGDFGDYSEIADVFSGIDACLFCLGVSVTQVPDEQAYRRITHDFTLAAARALHRRSPSAAFHYISGRGTHPESRMMWARVKGATERELMHEVGAVCWRPAFIDAEPAPGAPWMLRAGAPVMRLFSAFPTLYVDGRALGRAMLQATRLGLRRRIVENPEIRTLGE